MPFQVTDWWRHCWPHLWRLCQGTRRRRWLRSRCHSTCSKTWRLKFEKLKARLKTNFETKQGRISLKMAFLEAYPRITFRPPHLPKKSSANSKLGHFVSSKNIYKNGHAIFFTISFVVNLFINVWFFSSHPLAFHRPRPMVGLVCLAKRFWTKNSWVKLGPAFFKTFTQNGL